MARWRAVVRARRRGWPAAVARPALGRQGEGLLRGFLGEVEVAEEADERGQHATPFVAKDLFELQ